MNELFVPYTEALQLKELGFNVPCLATYHKELHTIIPIYAKYTNQDVIKAPIFSQAFKWFRNKYEIYHHINPLTLQSEKTVRFNCEIKQIGSLYALGTFSSFEEAESECIKKLIEIVKEQKK